MPKRKRSKSTVKCNAAEQVDVESGEEGRARERELVGEMEEVQDREEEGVVESESELENEDKEHDKVGDGVSVDGVKSDLPEEGPSSGKKPRIAGLYRPPTHDELCTLKETQNLFQSNLMRLQIMELLSEVKPASCSKLDELLSNLRATLMALPATEPVDLCDALQTLPSKIHYPIHLNPLSVKGKFTFHPPVAVKVVGSYILKSAIKSDLNVDLALQIPIECLQAKDHLNYRYLHKRALYLCHVAAHLRKKKKRHGLKTIEFGICHDGPLKPILILTPEDKPLNRYTIRLHTTIPETPFKPVKLAPNRNNLRPHALQQLPSNLQTLTDYSNDNTPEDTTDDLQPTPYHNSLILGDMGAMERHLSEIYTAQQTCPAMVDAITLFRVWARQREIEQGCVGFTGFHFSMLLTFLMSQRKITSLMSSYQIFRVALQTIASSDWSTTGISMATQDPSLPTLSTFHTHHSVVFLDSTGLLNLISHLSLSHYMWLRHETSLSLQCLNTPASDGFKALFMTPVHFEMKFDLLIHISPPDVLNSFITRSTNDRGRSLLLDRGTWPLPPIMDRVFLLLNKGLGKRVKLLTFRPFKSSKWLPWKQPVLPCDSHVTVGVALDTDHAFSVLDKGPTADCKQAAEFRSFWGERSELRRFQDGSITEAMVWNGDSVGEKRGVVTEAILHLLNRHCDVPVDSVVSSAGLLHPLISLPHYSHNSTGPSNHRQIILATGEEQCKKIEDVFTEFTKQLRGLKGLPLPITSVQGASPEFRHTAVFPATPWNGRMPHKMLAETPSGVQSDCLYPSCDSATPPFIPAMEVVIQLEISGKWPTELMAISHIKTSFYTSLSQSLTQQYHLICSPTNNHLDVLKNGYVFRLRIHYHRELAILRETISTAKSQEITQMKRVLSDMERQLVDMPLLTSILHGVSLQYSAFAPGARLCKRWIAAHLLTNHIADEVVELMVARLFIHPEPFTPPNSPECVLLRYLSLLSTHDWEAEPLIVNLNNKLSASDVDDINTRFTAQRDHLPSCYIATPLHRDSSPLTSHSPSFPVLYRACLLARESLALLSNQITSYNLSTTDIKQVFRTPLTGYNILIHLHKKHVPLVAQSVDAVMETGSTHSKKSSRINPTHFPITDFNPVEKYLTELENAFSEFCLFFYDKYGGRFIAVVWKPQAFIPQPFKVMQSFCKVKTTVRKDGKKKSESMFLPDVKAILTDFELMGDGLVSSVQLRSF